MPNENENENTNETVEQLKERLAQETEKRRRYQAQVMDFEKKMDVVKKYGVDDLGAVLEDYQNLKNKTTNKNSDINKIIQEKERELEKKYLEPLNTLKQKLTNQEQELKKYKITLPALEKAKSLFKEDALDLLKEKFVNDLDLDSEKGMILVKDQEGGYKISRNDPTTPMGLDEYLNNLANKYPSLVKEKGVKKSVSSTSFANINANNNGENNLESITAEQALQVLNNKQEFDKLNVEQKKVILKKATPFAFKK